MLQIHTRNPKRLTCRKWLRHCKALLLTSLFLAGIGQSFAQGPALPGFWDPQHRSERTQAAAPRLIRFITEDDYPPFNFLQADGSLSGFNVELARAICDELKTACTIQARRWDRLSPSLANGESDAAIASILATPQARASLDFTAPYYLTPGRFVTKRAANLPEPLPENLKSRRVGVIADSTHEAFLRARFASVDLRTYPDIPALQAALKGGEIAYLFADGVTLAIWLNGTDSADCCVFSGGPYLEEAYFGEGIGIAVRKGNDDLRRLLDHALQRLWQRGIYTDLYLRFFPIGFF